MGGVIQVPNWCLLGTVRAAHGGILLGIQRISWPLGRSDRIFVSSGYQTRVF